MRRLLLCFMFFLFLFSANICVTATVVGDGYGTIGGDGGATQIQPPVVIVPQDPMTVVPSEQPEQQSVPQEKVIKKKEPPKKEDVSSEVEEVVSRNTISKKITPPVTPKKTEPSKEADENKKIDISNLFPAGKPAVVEKTSFQFDSLIRVLKIVLTIVLSYVVVFAVFGVITLPKLYMLNDNGDYRLAAILLIFEKEDGFYIKIPKRLFFYGEDTNPAKICFSSRFVKKRQGNTLYVKNGKRHTSYMIEKEVSIYLTREED